MEFNFGHQPPKLEKPVNESPANKNISLALDELGIVIPLITDDEGVPLPQAELRVDRSKICQN